MPAAYPLVSLFWMWFGMQHGVIMCFLTTDRRCRSPSLLFYLFYNGLTPASLILEFSPRFDIYNWKELERSPDLARIPLAGNIGAISVKIHFLRFYIPCIELPSLSISKVSAKLGSAKFESTDRQHTIIEINGLLMYGMRTKQ